MMTLMWHKRGIRWFCTPNCRFWAKLVLFWSMQLHLGESTATQKKGSSSLHEKKQQYYSMATLVYCLQLQDMVIISNARYLRVSVNSLELHCCLTWVTCDSAKSYWLSKRWYQNDSNQNLVSDIMIFSIAIQLWPSYQTNTMPLQCGGGIMLLQVM